MVITSLLYEIMRTLDMQLSDNVMHGRVGLTILSSANWMPGHAE